MYVIIPGVITIATWFELMFVNGFGLPFNTGVIIYAFALVGALVFGILYTIRKKLILWNTVLISVVVILIGYSSFAMIVIRSSANPPMDQNSRIMYLLYWVISTGNNMVTGLYCMVSITIHHWRNTLTTNLIIFRKTGSMLLPICDKNPFSIQIYVPSFLVCTVAKASTLKLTNNGQELRVAGFRLQMRMVRQKRLRYQHLVKTSPFLPLPNWSHVFALFYVEFLRKAK